MRSWKRCPGWRHLKTEFSHITVDTENRCVRKPWHHLHHMHKRLNGCASALCSFKMETGKTLRKRKCGREAFDAFSVRNLIFENALAGDVAREISPSYLFKEAVYFILFVFICFFVLLLFKTSPGHNCLNILFATYSLDFRFARRRLREEDNQWN